MLLICLAASGLQAGLQLLVRTLPVMPAHLYEAGLVQSLKPQGDIVRRYTSKVDEDTATLEVVLLPCKQATSRTSFPPVACLRGEGWLFACGDGLLDCANHLEAAAAVLSEFPMCDEEEPGAMSAAGSELARAGHSCQVAAACFDQGDWPAATEPLCDAAGSLASAAANLDAWCGGAPLANAAAQLDDASSVTAAAGPSMVECGSALVVASIDLDAYADELAVEGTPAHAEAGAVLRHASAALRDAGAAMEASGAALERGDPP